ncbi:MAG: transporter [Phycisphaerales bacterium]|nr:transporter [Phycisphaerales bacterium]
MALKDAHKDVTAPAQGARSALLLLLLINLFNYIDRYVLAAVEPEIEKQFFPNHPPNAETWMGLLATAFMVSYMITAPVFGWLADRTNRWVIVGGSVVVWSIATGCSGLAGLAGGFTLLLITRLFVGIGEAGYGPAAPTLISDMYPIARRGAVLSWFYMAIPVGSALGYVLGGQLAQRFGWPSAFYAVVAPGLALGAWCFFKPDPPRGQCDAPAARDSVRKAGVSDYSVLLRTPSYVLNCAGMAAMTFAIGGISFWIPKYLAVVRHDVGDLKHVTTMFGAITVVAGLIATLAGGLAGDKLRKRFPSSYFLVSGIAILISCPFILLMLHAKPPWVWVYTFLAVFFLFFNTGPTNAVLANVTHPSMRGTAFALNIFIIHALGDAASPPILGKIGHYSWDAAFGVVAGMTALAGVLWLWGCRHLDRDTAAAPNRLNEPGGFPIVPNDKQ